MIYQHPPPPRLPHLQPLLPTTYDADIHPRGQVRPQRVSHRERAVPVGDVLRRVSVRGVGVRVTALGFVRFFGTEKMIFPEFPGLLMASDERTVKCGWRGAGEECGVRREFRVLTKQSKISLFFLETKQIRQREDVQ